MPRKIDHKRISFNASFGISPEQLAKEINALPLTARVLTIDAVPAGWMIADISGFALADYQQIEIRIEPDERMS